MLEGLTIDHVEGNEKFLARLKANTALAVLPSIAVLLLAQAKRKRQRSAEDRMCDLVVILLASSALLGFILYCLGLPV